MQITLIVIAVILVFIAYIFHPKNDKVEAKCGHKTRLSDEITAFGETVRTKINPREDGSVDYCHDCLEDMAIQCAWCQKPIFIGDPITLYSTRDKSFEIPENAKVYDLEPLRLVGCLRMSCADTGADRAGFWIPPGTVKRVPTAFEMLMDKMLEGEERPSVVIGDVSKP